MTETRTEYASGVFCWVDLSNPDLDGVVRFYGELFGWDARTLPGSDRYTMFTRDGKPVAGVLPRELEGRPPAWNTYIAVADAEVAAKAVESAGGRVHRPPAAERDHGVVAVCSDPEGAVFFLWQSLGFAGASLVNEVGSWCWNELLSRDPERAREFYPQVFGWHHETEVYDGLACTKWSSHGRLIGSMVPLEGQPDTPPHWMVYFTVADLDDATARATALGGARVAGPMDVGTGLVVLLRDPYGTVFAVIRMADQPDTAAG
ncbi:VOC family protein [Streptomyces beigongshangae]|uniref:VOC family protein n=1 Tax=Streptomyces beigongshangae TaxID=2841597 RepID=UPI001C84923A|nr:VOC family protein [Streptomyces sp. REN17]